MNFYDHILVSFAMLLVPRPAVGDPLASQAADFKSQLASKILPYWYDTALDQTNGGYLLADDLKGRTVAKEKQLVSQARLVWGYSHACLHGFKSDRRDYLKAAAHGYRFLLDHFWDREHGGCFWMTDVTGKVIDDRKIVYGEGFVIYALAEYSRASGDKEPLRLAMEVYQTLQEHAYDAKNGGWVEHFQRDWTPLPRHAPNAQVEVAGLKSANTHLHLMEALTELYDATHDPAVRKSLEEALHVTATYFYPPDPSQAAFHREPDWKPVTDPASAGLSYGHNVEFAWLMVHAQKTLGRKPSWRHFYAYIDHALKYGYDHERGGLYSRGSDNQPATDTDKVWWVQAEMMAALSDAIQHKKNPAYAEALEKLIRFVNAHQTDPADGIWLDTVTADGKPKFTGKAHSWKGNYHDVRGIVKFVEAFAPVSQPAK
jgi:mannobiose 2-epimerase